MGGVLLQLKGDKEVPIAFVSKSFTKTQSHYPTYEKELLAVIYTLGKLRHYVQGVHFFLQVDHRNILFLERSENPKMLRWRDFLRAFDFTIQHIPGVTNVVADCLSRLMTLTDAHIVKRLSDAHNAITGHRGVKLTLDMLRQSGFEWKTMREDVEKFVKSCATCQKSKPAHAIDPPASILPLEPFASVSVDTIGPLPVDDGGNCYIVAVIDDFSRFVEVRAAPDATAHSAARVLIDVFGRFGAPKILKSDNGPQFVAQLIDTLLGAMNVVHEHSLAYRPQSNSIVERANGEILRHLRALVFDSRTPNSWSSMLPFIQRIVNSTPHASTQIAPAQIVYGNRISLNRGLLTSFVPTSDSSSVQDHIAHLVAEQNDLIERSKAFVLRHREEVEAQSRLVHIPFNVGDLVLVRYPQRPPSKLGPKWRGPYRILSRESHSTFKLQHVSNLKEFVQHSSMLKSFDSTRSDPVAVAAVDDDEFEVESIIAHRGRTARNLTFKVRWLGYPPSQDSWLRLRDVKDLAALDTYLSTCPALRKLKLPGGRG
jgi:transposase InsO family protein